MANWKDTMSLSKKKTNVQELPLESDVEVTSQDIRILRQRALDSNPDLVAYFEFLEDIGAFESRKTRAKIFDELFTL